MIGYYVHHHGRGHLSRAASISAHLRGPVTVLTSIPTSDQSHYDVIRLPRDDGSAIAIEPTANDAFHWAPLHHNGLRERMRLIVDWVAAAKPAVMVVDVSVEVATLARLLGVSVVVIAMPGDRTDPAHELVHRLADHIVAPWPQDLYEPSWLQPHAAKTTYVGGISRFDGFPPAATPRAGAFRVLVLNGAGGSAIDITAIKRCASAHPRMDWTTLGVPGGPWAEDPWPILRAADIVISPAGQNSVAEIASADRPAIILPQERPFGEQHATAEALDRGQLAVTHHGWPTVQDWPNLIDAARSGERQAWQRWQTRGAALRAAAAIEHVAWNGVL